MSFIDLRRPSVFLVCFFTIIMSALSQQSLVTWVTPDASAPGLLKVESASGNPTARIVNSATGEPVTTVEQLHALGWIIKGGTFENTAEGKGGDKIGIEVGDLVPGEHRLLMRYFWQPRKRGEAWHYLLYIGMDRGATNLGPLSLVQGLGGFDHTSMYESVVGTPTESTSADVWFYRYVATAFSRIGKLRIETTPSPMVTTTLQDEAINTTWRDRFLADQSPWGALAASSLIKVRPGSFNDLQENADAIGETIRLSAARDERENAQVLLFAPQKVSGLTWKVGALTAEGGVSLPANVIDLDPVGYVLNPTIHDEEMFGYWPDPLLPFIEETDLEPGMVQSLWVRVNVPADAKPGIYRSEIELQSSTPAHTVRVPIEVEVWDFAMPRVPGLRVITGGGSGEDAMRVAYKMNPSNIYGWFLPEETIRQYAEWPVNAINLAYFHPGNLAKGERMPSQDQINSWVAQIGKSLAVMKECGIEHTAYVYMFDEAKEEWHPAMDAVAGALRTAYPELLVLTTAFESRFNGATDRVENVNGWIPVVYDYRKAIAEKSRRNDDEVWYYTCNVPLPPFPGALLINSPIESRIITGFMPQGFAVDGYLYYATTLSWGDRKITKGPFTDWVVIDNDHGSLYPRGPSGAALPSIRMEYLRDGIEDYDLITMALAALTDRGHVLPESEVEFLKSLTSTDNVMLSSEATLENPPEDMEGHLKVRPADRIFTSFERRPAEFEKLRQRVGSALSEMQESTPSENHEE